MKPARRSVALLGVSLPAAEQKTTSMSAVSEFGRGALLAGGSARELAGPGARTSPFQRC
jgi:hypothetical protein